MEQTDKVFAGGVGILRGEVANSPGLVGGVMFLCGLVETRVVGGVDFIFRMRENPLALFRVFVFFGVFPPSTERPHRPINRSGSTYRY